MKKEDNWKQILPTLGILIGLFLSAFSAILDYPLGLFLGVGIFFISGIIGLTYFKTKQKQEKK